ncbi:hypothetical protein LPJ58_001333 [Coemansia sp. RSA 1591]|nr:hypothetical protein LPJ58_001333 [Coemansia sp. RSA 1591]KAJ2166171.1 hypothetical protein GGH15_002915 [Coemansia sp. RSA 562]KAJ2173178.1 hypothetical protein GGH16_001972 [Coemansia sp. RSA 560]KAJ2181819.1 hypothetical protein EV181_005121 [Coemansia sp. RSA 532]KAJ2289287.1 hypothetical protein IW141_003918 [Coemansia sp. RSA 355]
MRQHMFGDVAAAEMHALDMPNAWNAEALFPANIHRAATQALESWITAQDAFSRKHILNNFASSSDGNGDARAGAICASPSRKHPDYYYAWTRDSALVVLEVIAWLDNNKLDYMLKDELKQRLDDYVEFTRHLQGLKNLKYGLGEAKFHMDGTAFRAPWCNAQTDGPALRARAILAYTQHVIKQANGDTTRAHELFALVRTDLDYVTKVWMHLGNCDIWEESRGMHFYTLLAQKTALEEGARMAHTLDVDNSVAHVYERAAQEIAHKLPEFWDVDHGYIVATLNKTGGIQTKNSNLDAQVLLAALHHGTPKLLTSRAVAATVNRLVHVFDRLYVVNHVQRTKIDGQWVDVAAAVGRYPEDVYDGDGSRGGNPWSLLTSSVAEYHYRLAVHMGNGPLAQYLVQVGDTYMARVARHTDADHTMREQWDKSSGYGRGAVHLTWSYAAHTSASRWRNLAIASLD